MFLQNSIILQEPKWWENILSFLNDFANSHYYISKAIPLTADIFVFIYPIFLVWIYLYWIYKKNIEYKIWALYVFFSWFISVLLNLFIQYFVDKQRPEQSVLSKTNLILSHIPDKPFPSDHAAISAWIAMSTFIWWIKTKNCFLKLLWIIFWIFCLVMSLSRVAAGVHWFTDILVGILIWIIVSLLLYQKDIFKFCEKNIYKKLVSLQVYIFTKIFSIKS